MNGKRTLYIDQWGNRFWASTVRELKEELGRSKASRMFRDTRDGTKHVGYVIGSHWLTAYAPVEIPA